MNTLANLFARSGIGLAFGITFTLLLVAAAGMDVRYRRISNVLVLAIFVLGALFAALSEGPRDAALRVLEGVGTGLAVWLPLWALGKLGAGDVKFFAAACAWLGPWLALEAALASAMLGGALALSWLLWRAASKSAVSLDFSGPGAPVDDERDGLGRILDARELSSTLPYGVAMAAGLAITAWFPHLMY
jgi:prepilin peptidase CpaA